MVEMWSKIDPKTVQNESLTGMCFLISFENRTWHQPDAKWLDFDLQIEVKNR